MLKELNAADLTVSLDLLGESVHSPEEARTAQQSYLELLDRIQGSGGNGNVSVKLTQMGLDIDEAICLANLRAVIGRAKQYHSFVRLDMEGSAYTERTLEMFTRTLYPEFGQTTGVVLQSYLRRTAQDVDAMIGLAARVRLCKGAYKEPAAVAFPNKADVDANYVACMEQLMERGNYPGLATHDEKIIEHAKEFANKKGIRAERFEFQMLYGVRRDLQMKLRKEGWNLRVYVPYGTHWYPYLMRRLAERPANLWFILGNVIRESLRRS